MIVWYFIGYWKYILYVGFLGIVMLFLEEKVKIEKLIFIIIVNVLMFKIDFLFLFLGVFY